MLYDGLACTAASTPILLLMVANQLEYMRETVPPVEPDEYFADDKVTQMRNYLEEGLDASKPYWS